MERKASAVWCGEVKSGQGSLSTASGVLKETQFSFRTRFENGVGTNPEELLAAAHAGCFAMALSAQLGMDAAVKAAEIGCPVAKLFRAAISVDSHPDTVSSAT